MNGIVNPPFASDAAAAAEDTVKRVAQGAHTIVDRVADKAGPAVERLRSGVSNAAESLQSGAQELGDIQKRWVESCRGCVRDHPLVSIGLAIAAGVIAYRLLERRA